jgi:hypothetical protein
MNPHRDGKPEPADPEQMLRMVELEMIQQRALRTQATARHKNLRALSFLFLFLVILGVAFAAYFAFTSGRVDDLRARSNAAPSPTPAVTARP